MSVRTNIFTQVLPFLPSAPRTSAKNQFLGAGASAGETIEAPATMIAQPALAGPGLLLDLLSDDPRMMICLGTWAASPPVLRPHHATNRIEIGKFCCFGENVIVFSGGDHPMHLLTQHHLKLYLGTGNYEDWSAVCRDNAKKTVIGNDVWLGDGSMVLSGVTVGDGAVIGARAVVARDVPPYAVVTGNRATVVRPRFDDRTIAALLELRWWDWPYDDLVGCQDILWSGDIQALIDFGAVRGRA